MAFPFLAAALLAGGAAGGYASAKAKNKKLKGVDAPFAPYSGYRPPHVSFLRPVEDQITKIVMERSRGEGVGYDPKRREELLENYEIEQDRDLEDTTRDLQNRLSGMGLSRNAAAYDDLVGRALREAGREKNLYRNRVDIEDLARRNEERDINTQRLSDLNRFNFGQENAVADFDLDVFNAESGNERARRGLQLNAADQYEDPFASALEGAGNAYFLGQATQGRGTTISPSSTPLGYDPRLTSSTGLYNKQTDYRKDPTYLALINRGYNLSR